MGRALANPNQVDPSSRAFSGLGFALRTLPLAWWMLGSFALSQPSPLAETHYSALPEAGWIEQIRDRMRDNLLRLPNYTCTETIERTRQPLGGGAVLEDTLRLEVALVDRQEIFAWPGSTEFQDTELKNLISTGTYGNGTFGIYAEMLFLGRGPGFLYSGTTEINDREVLQFDYRVPLEESRFHLTVDQREAIVAYHGSIYADRETLDLVRLEIAADNIPEALGLLASSDRVDYQRVDFGEEDFLLPSSSHLIMQTVESSNENFVRFSGCRRFTGQSTLVFDDPEFQNAAQATEVQEVILPPDVEIHLKIESDIDLRSAAIGDEVLARIDRDVKIDGREVIPKGAIARGRIVRLDRHPDYFLLGMNMTEIQWPGGHAKVNGYFDRVALSGVRLAGRGSIIDMQPVEGYILIRRPGMNRIRDFLTFWRTR